MLKSNKEIIETIRTKGLVYCLASSEKGNPFLNAEDFEDERMAYYYMNVVQAVNQLNEFMEREIPLNIDETKP